MTEPGRARSPRGDGADAGRRDREDPRDPGRRPADGHRAARRRRWPMIVLRTPKGWTGPAEVDGLPVDGTWRAHQVPLAEVRTNPQHLRQLQDWLRSYRPEELFGSDGRPARGPARPGSAGDPRAWAPARTPTAACCCATWPCRTSATTRSRSPYLARQCSEPTRVLGALLRDVHAAERGSAQLPRLRSGRDRVQPARRAAGGNRQDLGGGDPAGRRQPGQPTAG